MVHRVVIGFGILLVIGFLAFDIRGWLDGSRPVTRRQKGLRIASAALITIALGMNMVGSQWVGASSDPKMLKVLGAMCVIFSLLLVLAAVCLMLIDLREVRKGWESQREQNMVDLLRIAQEELEKERAKSSDQPQCDQ